MLRPRTGVYFLSQTIDYVSDDYLPLISYLEFEEIKLGMVFLLLLPGTGVKQSVSNQGAAQSGAVGRVAASPGCDG